MFILTNDGGNQAPKGSDIEASRILAQRSFLFDLSKQGFALALLYGAEYRDSKVRYTSALCNLLICSH